MTRFALHFLLLTLWFLSGITGAAWGRTAGEGSVVKGAKAEAVETLAAETKRAAAATNCFTAGTLVLTENGSVPIELLKPGDLVWSCDVYGSGSGDWRLEPVVACYRHEYEDLLITVTVDEVEVTVTKDHPFWVVAGTDLAHRAVWEADIINNQLPATQTDIQPQITVKSSGPSSKRVRLDAVGTDAAGAVRLTDGKASPTVPHTPNQTVVYPELEVHGGTVVGKGKGAYLGGTVIPPTKVDIIRKP